MNFYIKKNSLLPKLKISLYKDGLDTYGNEYSLENSIVKLNFIDVDNGFYRSIDNDVEIVYEDNKGFIVYNFKERDTKKIGNLKVELTIENLQGKTVLPFKDDIIVSVIESLTIYDLCCQDKDEYVSFTSDYIDSNLYFDSRLIIPVLECQSELFEYFMSCNSEVLNLYMECEGEFYEI